MPNLQYFFLFPSRRQGVLRLPAGLGLVCVSVMCCSTWLALLMGNLISDNHGLQGMPALLFTLFRFMSSFRLEKHCAFTSGLCSLPCQK